MGVAAAVSQGRQLAQHGEGDGGAQGAFELRHGGDFLVPQERGQSVAGVANNVHNVNMTLFEPMSSVIFTFCKGMRWVSGGVIGPVFTGHPEGSRHPQRRKRTSGYCAYAAFKSEVIFA